MARSMGQTIPDRMKEALRQVEGAFAIVAMTRTKLIGVRDARGIRPLVLGKLGDGYVLASETCALDIIGAELVREIKPGEMVVISGDKIKSYQPFEPVAPRPCIFEYVYFSRPDSTIGGRSVYEVRREIGRQLAIENPVDADMVCPVPDSGTPAAIGFSQQSGIPFEMGIVRNQYVGRTFIEPTEQIRNMGVRLKLNVNRTLMKNKRVILIDDSIVRGTTSRKIKEMILEAGAKEVHFRIASPPTIWPDFYGVDMPTQGELLAARMTEDEMRDYLGVSSLKYISIDGLYRAVGEPDGRDPAAPAYHDAVFTGDYPIIPSDMIEAGFKLKAAE
jgi:amidophosphoribosyltransferase